MPRGKSVRVPASRIVGLKDLRDRMTAANDLAYDLGPTSAQEDFHSVMEALHEAYWIAAALADGSSKTGCRDHPQGPIDPEPPEGWGACLLCNSRRRTGLARPRTVTGQKLTGATVHVNRPRQALQEARRPTPPEAGQRREPAAVREPDSPVLAARRAGADRTHAAALARARQERAHRNQTQLSRDNENRRSATDTERNPTA